MEQFQVEFNTLVSASLAENTKFVYENAKRVFEDFRVQFKFNSVWPPPLAHLVNFVLHLSNKKIAPSTVRTYIAGLSFYSKCFGGEDHTHNFLLKKILEGMRRTVSSKDTRAPITLDMLKEMPFALQQICSSHFESKLFLASFLLAFFGLLRVSEIVVCRGNSGRALQIDDISLNSNSVEINIRFSKTDQLGRSTKLSIAATGASVCPVQAIKQYLAIRPSTAKGPLFCHFNGKAVTRFQFATVLHKALKFAGYDVSSYKTHSFRIGGATQAALKGLSSDTIQKLGRWKSDVYKRYIQLPVTN